MKVLSHDSDKELFHWSFESKEGPYPTTPSVLNSTVADQNRLAYRTSATTTPWIRRVVAVTSEFNVCRSRPVWSFRRLSGVTEICLIAGDTTYSRSDMQLAVSLSRRRRVRLTLRVAPPVMEASPQETRQTIQVAGVVTFYMAAALVVSVIL